MFDVILNGARKIWHRVTSSGTCPSSPSSSAPVEAQGMEAEEFFYWHEMLDGFKKNDQRTCLQMMPAGAKEMLSSSELFNDGDVEDFVNWQERYAQRRQGFSEPGPSPSANDHCVDLQDLEDENSDSEASSSSLGLGSEYEEDTASEWSEDNFEFAFDCK
ncbi:hypothetical protein B9Z55_017112 [Caenorhabditis nigoni]|uniref:Uncharacterized protein n=1 Tax=Caenorhabditis nigoni TaxID=1611254 RepID=A0A2G5T7M9_9PELO|nr:hypothetical protein B9Z55_017112 [Caenorhabditis nigoni]